MPTLATSSAPQCEAASIPLTKRIPSYFIEGTNSGFDIFINLADASKCFVSAVLGSDNESIQVIGLDPEKKANSDYLWIFALPKNARKDAITFDRRREIFNIHIPKKLMSV